jgi:DNA invertase Pin-like site-specific DNA recombinase
MLSRKMSQRHAGWVALPDMYDDGGLSGGTMERPALQRLLADVKAGKVQIIVVYKVDRLTRSLADFAKIVDVLDAHGASFVSVTQQFDTTISMGRLTLKMLLSFAQFEREIAGERIRDKIAASKAKGGARLNFDDLRLARRFGPMTAYGRSKIAASSPPPYSWAATLTSSACPPFQDDHQSLVVRPRAAQTPT